jgi:hypothetical protein
VTEMIYCENSHFVSTMPERSYRRMDPGLLRNQMQELAYERLVRMSFCTKCGAQSIPACPSCERSIEVDPDLERPSYCRACGKPFPWTEVALATAKEYTDEIEGLSEDDKITLKGIFADLTVDTAKTPLAGSRFKKMLGKVAPAAGNALLKILGDVVTAEAKRFMGLS